MIEVTARLNQGVFLAGETVEVAITVKNPSPPADAKSQWNDLEEVLAWASAQIHCQCWVNQYKVKVPAQNPPNAEESAVTNSLTSFAPCRIDYVGSAGAVGGGGGGQNSAGSTQANNNVGGGGSTGGGSGRVVLATKPVILFCDLRLLPGESQTCKIFCFKLF
jgi:hypothetical protein